MSRSRKLDRDISLFLKDVLGISSVSEFKSLCKSYGITYVTGLKILGAKGAYEHLLSNRSRIEAYEYYKTIRKPRGKKLSNERIIEIFNDKQNIELIAEKYNVSTQTVLNIKNRRGRYGKVISHFTNKNNTTSINENTTRNSIS